MSYLCCYLYHRFLGENPEGEMTFGQRLNQIVAVVP